MARLRDALIGHGDLVDQLLPTLQADGIAVTFLFAGPSGIGKRTAALALAQAMLCERSSVACGECGSCLRVEKGLHESLLQLAPDGMQIKTEQAHQVLEFLQLARLGRARVIIIDQAQSLNPQAANSLLKVLEEPPEGTFIFLIAPSPSSVLPTLRSRSRSVLFAPLKESELKRFQIAPEWTVKAARGSVERLNDLLDPEEQELRQSAARILESFLNEKEFLTAAGWRETVKEKGNLSKLLTFWSGFLRDGLVLHAKGPGSVLNPDLKELLSRLAKEPRALLERFVDRLFKLQAEMSFHRDPQLAVEELWVYVRSQRA